MLQKTNPSDRGYLSWLIKQSYMQTISWWQHLGTLQTGLFVLGKRSKHLAWPKWKYQLLLFALLVGEHAKPRAVHWEKTGLINACLVLPEICHCGHYHTIRGHRVFLSAWGDSPWEEKCTFKSSDTLSLPPSVFTVLRLWTCFSWVVYINTHLLINGAGRKKSKGMSENSGMVLFPAGELFSCLVRDADTMWGTETSLSWQLLLLGLDRYLSVPGISRTTACRNIF